MIESFNYVSNRRQIHLLSKLLSIYRLFESKFQNPLFYRLMHDVKSAREIMLKAPFLALEPLKVVTGDLKLCPLNKSSLRLTKWGRPSMRVTRGAEEERR